VIDNTQNKKMEKKKTKVGKGKMENLAEAKKNSDCKDRNCHIHGNLKTRGRIFEGKITKKFPKRITIEFERMIYVRKYERYKKSKTKIHARLPICMEDKIQIGDLIKIQECRPLSKIIHFVVIGKVKGDKEK
tara:strand:+ start:287 stop:682 length:396 start_codon:yes stop_codon:yes gene_type:complete